MYSEYSLRHPSLIILFIPTLSVPFPDSWPLPDWQETRVWLAVAILVQTHGKHPRLLWDHSCSGCVLWRWHFTAFLSIFWLLHSFFLPPLQQHSLNLRGDGMWVLFRAECSYRVSFPISTLSSCDLYTHHWSLEKMVSLIKAESSICLWV